MIDILYTILIFSGLMVLFKLFDRLKVDNLQAIAVNYFVAGICGIVAMDGKIQVSGGLGFDNPNPQYFIPTAIIIGFLFGVVFNLIAYGTQKIGISITSVANKISLIIPVIFGIWWFQESANFIKITGLTLALLAIYFSTITAGKLKFNKKYLLLLLLIFLGQGLADSTFKFAQVNCVDATNSPSFFTLIFFASGITGSIFVFIKVIQKKTIIKFKNVFWGILLGIPNYFTLHFFFKALEELPASQVYLIVNMGIIVFLTLIGTAMFREKLSGTNWMGIVLAVIAIALITFSNEIFNSFG